MRSSSENFKFRGKFSGKFWKKRTKIEILKNNIEDEGPEKRSEDNLSDPKYWN